MSEQSAPRWPPRVSRTALWFGFLGGAVAWTLHLLAASFISEWGCLTGLARWQWLGLTSIAWLLIAASVLMLLLAIWATWVAYRLQHQLSEAGSTPLDRHGTATFLARAGLITNGVFTFIILAQCVPIFYFLSRC